jgi:hypothetical protein
MVSRSFVVSMDMAHGVHPNYAEKHEVLHRPQLQQGLVIKTNSNQRYATNTVSSYFIRCCSAAHRCWWLLLHVFGLLLLSMRQKHVCSLCDADAGPSPRDTASKCKTLSYGKMALAAGA